MEEQRLGIIDIGSNSVRLVVYERTARGAHRVVDGSKRSARLSEQIDEFGNLADAAIDELIDTLHHFAMICEFNHTVLIRTVATAAIRNAVNKDTIISRIQSATGLVIELLSGEQEAEYGFLGMINSIQIDNGYLIDIGGGSTELTLFKDRQIVHAVSFPFGCVSMYKKYGAKGMLPSEALQMLEADVAAALKAHSWIFSSPELPLIGIGGTIRALGKVHQAAQKYPFPQTHNYAIAGEEVDSLMNGLSSLPLDKRKKQPGLSKDRADVIVPGLAILRVVYRAVRASHYLICGAGLRDGLFRATRFPEQTKLDNVLGFSASNLGALHAEALTPHTVKVNHLALKLYDALQSCMNAAARDRMLLDTASRLFRIGASIDVNDYARHSFYLIVNSHLNGLSHREIIMTAAIAAFKSKGRTRSLISDYKELLMESDLDTICQLGSLLQLAAALDRSGTQSIIDLAIHTSGALLQLVPAEFRGSLTLEQRTVAELSHDFKKLWGVAPVLNLPS